MKAIDGGERKDPDCFLGYHEWVREGGGVRGPPRRETFTTSTVPTTRPGETGPLRGPADLHRVYVGSRPE